ncbi:hypothetical protein DFQ01_14228 [Paenibacillus cellulosilyticus]|uniref:DUF2935 family protein n=1 Tax=Paenibacillus cellulosilyticus TaxID=375489 RepID=A0A2V2YEG3_9BACL|nr:DUF2935 domain-containing protein [Paenibacillus cellulosilyticus]PWV90580.1 hypothetical protein DFQ01_14228 [Paenibacillus cellulosilyticus]QKS46782.1 DUF2935 domain-containing protein [Paenibacillus cellulosilyticus]
MNIAVDAQQAAAWFEHRFWLQILGDHSRFILNALSPKETNDVQQAQHWIIVFDTLLSQARNPSGGTTLGELSKQAYEAAMQLKAFKLSLLERLLLGKVTVGLPPTFFNHMVNELDEYARILQVLLAGKPVPLYEPLHYDMVWLPDASGHAGSILMELDRVERSLIERYTSLERHFNALFLKAVEMAGYMRTGLRDFPAFRRFHAEIDLEMRLFTKFLLELEELELSAAVLDTITPLMPDHMAREECYYLTKLAATGVVPPPNCDPAKPRVEG